MHYLALLHYTDALIAWVQSFGAGIKSVQGLPITHSFPRSIIFPPISLLPSANDSDRQERQYLTF